LIAPPEDVDLEASPNAPVINLTGQSASSLMSGGDPALEGRVTGAFSLAPEPDGQRLVGSANFKTNSYTEISVQR